MTLLDLGHNDFGHEGVEAVCDAVIHNTCILTLGLAQVGMGDKGALSMADVVRQNCSITELYLNRCRQISISRFRLYVGVRVTLLCVYVHEHCVHMCVHKCVNICVCVCFCVCVCVFVCVQPQKEGEITLFCLNVQPSLLSIKHESVENVCDDHNKLH